MAKDYTIKKYTMKQLLAQVQQQRDDIARLRKQFDDAVTRGPVRAENTKLREALRDFGRHNDGCNGPYPPHKCKCGWEDAKKLIEE